MNANNYNYIDYNKEINQIKNDYRTSYNFGHRNYLVNDCIGPPNKSIPEPCQLLAIKEARPSYATETSDQLTWKYPVSYDQKADLALPCHKPQFIQNCQERIFKNPPKPIKNNSSYLLDYTYKPAQFCEKNVSTNQLPLTTPNRSEVVIYSNRPGHYK